MARGSVSGNAPAQELRPPSELLARRQAMSLAMPIQLEKRFKDPPTSLGEDGTETVTVAGLVDTTNTVNAVLPLGFVKTSPSATIASETAATRQVTGETRDETVYAKEITTQGMFASVRLKFAQKRAARAVLRNLDKDAW